MLLNKLKIQARKQKRKKGEMSSDKSAGRVLLPQDAIPLNYQIKLSCDLENFIFDGEESILVDVVNSTSSISLHIKEILIKSSSFETVEGKKLELVSMSQDIDLQTVTLFYSEPLPLGKGGKINISYQGSHNNQMAGFYRSNYTNINGEQKVMVSTQFESLDARRCFPCWDEPAMKASFDVSLEVPVHMTAFSNMPETKSTYLPKGRKLVEYATSPVMSTYLLAFVVGEFDYLQSTTSNGVNVRVFTPPGKVSNGEFALDCACKCLDIYDDFFRVPYPLPKLDMVAIPEFAMGAMENWGAVTYREVDLLIDSKKASAQQKQRVATVVAHELAHQWFGNLVTMQWWDDLWLNEGFASWTENYAINLIYPDYKMWEQFTYTKQTAALNLDSLRSSHPIQVPIKHAREVEEVFDAISYCKGSSVVRMIYAVLGHADFQAGLQLYMERHQYSNTETYHLWNAWSEVSGKPIGEMMNSWTEQMGFPLLIVESIDSSVPGKMTFKLKQEWFLADGSLKKEEEEKLWTIPLISGTASSNKEGQFVSFMKEKTNSITIDVKSPNDWIKLNYNQESPFRVLYSDEMLNKLAEGVENKSLPPSDRAGLLLDTFAIVKAGKYIGGSALLRLLKAYRNEDNATVWDVIAMVLSSLNAVLKMNEDLAAKFEVFASSIILPAFEKVGWTPKPEDGHLDKMKRSTLVGLLSSFCWKDEKIMGEARKRFDSFVSDPSDTTNLPSDYKTSVFAMVLKGGGEAEFNQMLKICSEAESTVEKKYVYNSIGATEDLNLKRKALDWTNTEVKLQDFFYVIGSVSGSSYAGLEMTWAYFKENFAMYKSKLISASASLMDAVIIYSCGSYALEEKAVDIEEFFKANPMPQNARKIAQTVERIRVNASFYNRLTSDSDFVNQLVA